jgi:hypothetical protein
MGNSIFGQEFLQFDRMIDGESQIAIGIVSKKEPNPYSSQAIRIGLDGKLKRLETFEQTDNYLKFNYESNTTMTLIKRNKDVIINIKEPENEINMIKPMTSICREIFKPIKFGEFSLEYDKIPDFIRPKLEDIQTEIGKSIYQKEHVER